MEASALRHPSALPALAGRSPLLRLQSDERLIALTRRGHQGAFEALVQRYQPRLLAFCRHMLGSKEDAEDVLQEVFTAAFNAILADDRPINARPWLYRIARNRSLNHLRRPRPAGQDSMDVFERDGGSSTADTVHRREEFRQIVTDVGELPETQRTALLLREIDALSYDQIAEAMDTTVPSVKSLLVRARVSLAEAAEARLLTCEEVRLELGQVAEGLAHTTAPLRRHLKSCDRCHTFRAELRKATRGAGGRVSARAARVLQEAVAGEGRSRRGLRSGRRCGRWRRRRGRRRGRRGDDGRRRRSPPAALSPPASRRSPPRPPRRGRRADRHGRRRRGPARERAPGGAGAPGRRRAVARADRSPGPSAPGSRQPPTGRPPPAPAPAPAPEPAAVEPAMPVAPAPAPAPTVEQPPPAQPVQEDGSTVTLPPREEDPAEPTTPPGEPTEPGAQQPAEPGTAPAERAERLHPRRPPASRRHEQPSAPPPPPPSP